MPIKPNNKKGGKEQGRSVKSEGTDKRYSRLRGMKDVLFDEYKYWDLVLTKANSLAATYGFSRIETPVLERMDLYEKATGRETDIVSKEMYSFIDKSGDRVAMRPEATPSLVRAYIEHGMFNLPQPVKTCWIGPVFRHEKPQSGRFRQHNQFNLDIFGEASPVADVQLILIAHNFFSQLQMDVQVQINSIGCKACRLEYAKKLVEYYKERGKRSKLCNDCKKRLQKNPMRLLDCKEEGCQEMRADAPQIVDYICDDCKNHFIKVLEYLDELDVSYNLNPFLVRGLDYYNRTVFEIVPMAGSEDEEEAEGEQKPGGEPEGVARQSSLGGGGRYDELVEHMGGRPTPACGFALGIERVIMKIKEKNIPIKRDKEDLIFVAQLGDQARRKAMVLFEEMRKNGLKVRQSFTRESLKAQLEDANRIGARYCLILGQKELLEGTIILRDMDSGTQEVIDSKKVYNEVNKRLALGGNAQ